MILDPLLPPLLDLELWGVAEAAVGLDPPGVVLRAAAYGQDSSNSNKHTEMLKQLPSIVITLLSKSPHYTEYHWSFKK